MKKASLLILLVLMANTPAGLAEKLPALGHGLFKFDKAAAYEQYKRRPHTELSKLLYLKDVLKKSPCAVLYNGKTYSINSITNVISAYVRLNYKKEKAENWIMQHADRSASKGQVIYLLDPTGKRLALKDVLLQELKALPAA